VFQAAADHEREPLAIDMTDLTNFLVAAMDGLVIQYEVTHDLQRCQRDLEVVIRWPCSLPASTRLEPWGPPPVSTSPRRRHSRTGSRRDGPWCQPTALLVRIGWQGHRGRVVGWADRSEDVDDDLDRGAGGSVVLVTKLGPRRLRNGVLPREDLQRRLGDDPQRRLTLVAGPAGFGKTTLLSAWAASGASGSPVAWVSLDSSDNDTALLWTHVIAALRMAVPDFDTSANPGNAGTSPVTETVLPRLMNDLAGLDAMDLVFDDVHCITAHDSRDSLAWVVAHAPENLRLVMASRTEPRLPLAALRARGELVELRSDDLRFSEQETAELLNSQLGLGLGADDVSVLHERTEGWPAGLYLAALSLRGISNRHEFVDQFSASNRHVLDYLVDEVLSAHEPDMQDLMLRISILERINGPICDALLDTSGSAAALRELARSNLFLVPMDGNDEWYRFHHLFGQLLQLELQRRMPEEVPPLHRRASDWHRAHGTMIEAINHAFEAGSWAKAAALIEGCWPDFANAGQYQTVLTWLRRFPTDVLDGDVRLQLVEAWISSLCARRAQAAAVLTRIAAMAPHPLGRLPDGFSSIESSTTTLQALLPWGDVGAQLQHARRACELEPPESRWYPCVAWSVGAGLYYQDELEVADAWFDDAFSRAVVAGQWIVATSSLAYRSLIAGATGRGDDQQGLAEQAAHMASGCGLDDTVGEAHSARGVSLGARGEQAQALPLLEKGVDVMRAWGQPTELARSLLELADCLSSLGQDGAARSALDEARHIIDSCVDPGALSVRASAIARPWSGAADGRHGLTEREIEILDLMQDDLSERDIADRLYISFNTVHTHVRSIYRKLGVTSRPQALASTRSVGGGRISPR